MAAGIQGFVDQLLVMYIWSGDRNGIGFDFGQQIFNAAISGLNAPFLLTLLPQTLTRFAYPYDLYPID